MQQGKFISTGVVIFIGLILLLTFSNATFLTIEPGQRGVLFKRFGEGLVKDKIYEPGFHVIAPWNDMYVYDVREQQIDEHMKVLSNNGLDIELDVTVRVNPDYVKIGDLHEKFGRSEYRQSLIIPEVRSAVRKVIGRFNPEELYSSKREEVQTMIQEDLEESLKANFVDLKAVLIRDIKLPERVRGAIEEKLQAEQSALKYEYILEQGRKEAELKIIQANAKAEANRILSASLSDKILQDKGIDATLQLANSQNSKIIVVGSGDSGLPLILGNQ